MPPWFSRSITYQKARAETQNVPRSEELGTGCRSSLKHSKRATRFLRDEEREEDSKLKSTSPPPCSNPRERVSVAATVVTTVYTYIHTYIRDCFPPNLYFNKIIQYYFLVLMRSKDTHPPHFYPLLTTIPNFSKPSLLSPTACAAGSNFYPFLHASFFTAVTRPKFWQRKWGGVEHFFCLNEGFNRMKDEWNTLLEISSLSTWWQSIITFFFPALSLKGISV